MLGLHREGLRWFTIWAPSAFVAILITILVLQHPHDGVSLAVHLIVLVAVTAGALTFSHFVFDGIEAQEREIFRQNRDLAAMHAVGKLLSESRDLKGALSQVIDRVLEATESDAGEIALVEEGSGDLVLTVQRGPHPDAFREVTRFRPGEGIPGLVAASGEPVVTRNPAGDPRFRRRTLTEAGFRVFASVPLKSKNEVVGVLSVAAEDARRVGHAELGLLVDLGNQLGPAIESARFAEKLPAMAILEERQRIARELHDSLAQTLGYIQMRLSVVRRRSAGNGPESLAGELGALEQVARTAYAEVRQAIFGLRTMVSRDLGFVPTLTEYLSEVGRQAGLAIDLKVADDRAVRFPLETEVQVIRIIQEALHNVVKHAAATRAQVVIDLDGDTATIRVCDDGRGFDTSRAVSRHAFGLEAMCERARAVGGHFTVASADGQGTTVEVRLPVEGQGAGGRP